MIDLVLTAAGRKSGSHTGSARTFYLVLREPASAVAKAGSFCNVVFDL
jgi:hypothetical protein